MATECEPTANTRRQVLRAAYTSLFALAYSRTAGGCNESDPVRAPDQPSAAEQDSSVAPPPPARPDSGTAAPMTPPMTPPTAPTHVSCATVTTFAPIVDEGPRTAFVHTSESSTLDWVTIGISMTSRLSDLPDRVLDLLRGLERLQLGYPVDMLTHALQCASRARRAGASDDLVLAALCHCIGLAFTIEGYAELSAAVLRGYVSDAAYRIVRHFPEYSTLRAQPDYTRYAAQPWHRDALRFSSEWADPSFDPDYDTLALSEFEPLVRAKLGLSLHDAYVTRTDCLAGTP